MPGKDAGAPQRYPTQTPSMVKQQGKSGHKPKKRKIGGKRIGLLQSVQESGLQSTF